MIVDVLDGDRRVVDQDADRQRESPNVMMLISPSADRQQIDVKIDKGIEIVMIRVLRQLPKNNRINKPVSAPAITASRTTPAIARARTPIGR